MNNIIEEERTLKMSEQQQNRLKEILNKVNIDEQTFDINDHGTERIGSIAIIKESIDELIELVDEVNDGEFRNVVIHKVDFLQRVQIALLDGTYFSSIDDVWESKEESFEDIDITLFDRSYQMMTLPGLRYHII